jgi:hypothetical protein
MNILLRLTHGLHDRLLRDLRRPHPFAAERVAFAFGRHAATPTGGVIILSTFEPVPDADYEDDPRVGARIGAGAIHDALQRASTLGAAAFHTHLHEHVGTPRFSRTDLRELPPVMQPFAYVAPTQPRGLFLLSDDDCTGLVWLPRDKRPRAIRDVTVVGAPMKLLHGERR